MFKKEGRGEAGGERGEAAEEGQALLIMQDKDTEVPSGSPRTSAPSSGKAGSFKGLRYFSQFSRVLSNKLTSFVPDTSICFSHL